MMTIYHKAPTPPGQWRWTAPDSGTRLKAHAASKLIAAVRSYLHSNGLPEMTTEEIEHDICNQCGLGRPYCKGAVEVPRGTTTLSTLARFATTAKNWITGGLGWAPMEEVNRRANICASCPRNRPMGGCPDCNAELAAVLGTDLIVPKDRRPFAYKKLHNCQQCGCRLTLKTQLPAAAFVDDTAEYPKNCWMVELQRRD